MRTLVVHYSRTGTTRALAHQLADALGADLEELRDPTPRRGLGGGCAARGMRARRGTLVPLAPLRHDPAAFDLVVVGTPIWAGAVSSPVRTFLHHHRSHLRGLACFCTGGGGPATRCSRNWSAWPGTTPGPTCSCAPPRPRRR
ncbi:MAG: NAD(P)H-dependent oxidoreductase [Kofleriaceae bacterium]|nr:NAD(P)H-dependent oxidoreductase [Kofleriaceae bacterium]